MQGKSSFIYELIPSFIGEVGLVCLSEGLRPVKMVFLPHTGVSMTGRIRKVFPGAMPSGAKGEMGMRIAAFLDGEAVDFSIDGLDFDGVVGFARRVLQAGLDIPRRHVMTYGGVAAKLDVPGGARAVGHAMADNPFPLIIPCHRVVRSGGGLGGFGGGLPMKRALLKLEGVAFDSKGRIFPEYILTERSKL